MPKVVFRLKLKRPDIPRAVIVLIIGGFIQSVGNSLMWPLNSLFMQLGKPPYGFYIVAMLILTLGEMLILPAVPAAAAQLATFMAASMIMFFIYGKVEQRLS